ncbi:MAG: hypothetical protein HQM06_11375 [Magnetococcales bacterium]|nr:hypothetical protein [Magnetococcales bacterium]
MKIFLFWSVNTCMALLLAVALLPACAWAEEGGNGRRAAGELNGGRDLLAQQIRVDRPDLKMDGELILRTLKPLTAEIRLQRAQGEPKQIFAAVMRLLPGAKGAFDHFFEQVDIHDLTLTDLQVALTAEGYTLQLASAEIPEGALQQVRGWMDMQKNWQLESGPLHLRHLPLRAAKKMPPLPVSFKRLQASGERQERFSLEVERVKVGHLAMIADPERVWGEVLRSMGYARGLSSSPIAFDRLVAQWDVEARQIATRQLLLQAPGGTATGKAVMPWHPQPRKVAVTLDVTSSARRGESKHFQTVIPLEPVK